MPPLAILAAIGAGAYVGYKVVSRIASQVNEQLAEARKANSAGSATEKDLGRLELDEQTGLYRPVGETGRDTDRTKVS